jgi:hypothetical protein
MPLLKVAPEILTEPNLTIGNVPIYCAPVEPDTVMVWLR